MRESDIIARDDATGNPKTDENRKLSELEMEEAYLLGDEEDEAANTSSSIEKSPVTKVLIADSYHDDANLLKGCPQFVDELDIGKMGKGNSVFSFNKGFETSTSPLDPEKCLPPLKPKFESGLEDDSIFTPKFSHPTNLSPVNVGKLPDTSVPSESMASSVSPEEDQFGTSQRPSGGISFSMKKRKI